MSLHKLPSQAQYTAKQGRATVRVQVRDSLVYVYASCDSLAQQVEYYRGLAVRTHDNYNKLAQYHQELDRVSNPIRLGLGCLIGAAITFIIVLKIKNDEQK